MQNTLEAVQARRSHYALGSGGSCSNQRITELVKAALYNAPTAFHSQSCRILLLFGSEHQRLWSLTESALKPQVPPLKWQKTWDKLQALSAARGTVLFFDDEAVTAQYSAQYPLYGPRFPLWADQSSAMLQYAVWLLLEAEGLGASLQHYDPLIDDAVRNTWCLPASWRLIAQMPFGQPYTAPVEKTREPLESKIRILGQ